MRVMIDMLFASLTQLDIIIYGLVRKCVKFTSFSYTMFILDLDLNYIDKL